MRASSLKNHKKLKIQQLYLLTLFSLKIKQYLCRRSEKDSLRQKKRYALNLRNENLRNFQKQGCNKQGAEWLPRLGVGLYSIFLLQVFSGPSFRNWQKQSRASAMWKLDE